MSDHDFEMLKKRLADCEPTVSESLAGDVLRDVEVVLLAQEMNLNPCTGRAVSPRPPLSTSKRFSAQVHCTKKSRCLTTLLGASLGLLIGITLALAISGNREKQIVYVEVPIERESQTLQKPDRTQADTPFMSARAISASANPDSVAFAEIDRLIEETIEQKRQIVIPDSLRSHHADRRYVSSSGTISPDPNRLLLQRELLEQYQ